jgi:hypothetical protein
MHPVCQSVGCVCMYAMRCVYVYMHLASWCRVAKDCVFVCVLCLVVARSLPATLPPWSFFWARVPGCRAKQWRGPPCRVRALAPLQLHLLAVPPGVHAAHSVGHQLRAEWSVACAVPYVVAVVCRQPEAGGVRLP